MSPMPMLYYSPIYVSGNPFWCEELIS
uniref:Uncharacterized protein n=1 Tax=Anguilla anguilla TaxID=7936 RepID=A0A0E9PYA4_ANGAN